MPHANDLDHQSVVVAHNIGTTLPYNNVPFAARPLFSLAQKVEIEKHPGGSVNAVQGGEPKGNGSVFDGEHTEANGSETGPQGLKGADGSGGKQGSEGSGGNGERNWDGYQNYLLYMLTDHRKAQSAESCKVLEENRKLQAILESFRADTDLKMLKLELLVKTTALKILMAMFLLLVALVQYVLPYTPEGKLLRERIKKVFQQDDTE